MGLTPNQKIGGTIVGIVLFLVVAEAFGHAEIGDERLRMLIVIGATLFAGKEITIGLIPTKDTSNHPTKDTQRDGGSDER